MDSSYSFVTFKDFEKLLADLKFTKGEKLTPTESSLITCMWEKELKPQNNKVPSSRVLVLICGIEKIKV